MCIPGGFHQGFGQNGLKQRWAKLLLYLHHDLQDTYYAMGPQPVEDENFCLRWWESSVCFTLWDWLQSALSIFFVILWIIFIRVVLWDLILFALLFLDQVLLAGFRLVSIACIRIRTRVRIYGKIWSEPSGLPRAQAIFYRISLIQHTPQEV